MKTLLLVRHAKSSWAEPRQRDEDRPLNGRGERDAPAIGHRLAVRGVRPDAIVASPARRARDTALLLAGALGLPAGVIRLEPRIYEADAERLLEVVRETPGTAGMLLLVGHNPGLSELAHELIPDFGEELPTCGVVAVDLPVPAWSRVRPGAGSVAWLASPRRWS